MNFTLAVMFYGGCCFAQGYWLTTVVLRTLWNDGDFQGRYCVRRWRKKESSP